MSWYTKEEIEKLVENETGEEFFEEVRSHLSPEELEEYLNENPGERKYLKWYE